MRGHPSYECCDSDNNHSELKVYHYNKIRPRRGATGFFHMLIKLNHFQSSDFFALFQSNTKSFVLDSQRTCCGNRVLRSVTGEWTCQILDETRSDRSPFVRSTPDWANTGKPLNCEKLLLDLHNNPCFLVCTSDILKLGREMYSIHTSLIAPQRHVLT